jgi:YVTN family beta-propeller protein
VGTNPQQIAFSPDGSRAYVAAGRSNQVTVVNAVTYEVEAGIVAPGIPMGVGVLPTGEVLVSLFKDGRIERFDPESLQSQGSLEVGDGPSFFEGPLPDGSFLVSSERANRFQVIDPKALSVLIALPMGDRPFPPAVTSDGRFAFIGSYVQGTVAIVDLHSKMIVGLVPVGNGISGGAVLPGDQQVALAVREEDWVAVLDLRSRQVVKSLRDGIGERPFNVTISVDGRLAFVNNTQSGDISVLGLPELQIIDRVPVGPIPAAVAAHPDGDTLWISCEGDHQLYILEIPERWRSEAAG